MNKSSRGALLKVHQLNVASKAAGNPGRILRDINLTVKSGQIIGIEGDSGSGKTVLAKSVMGLIEAPLYVESGEIVFCGQNIAHLSDRELSDMRGSDISLILQNPMSSLDPLMKIGDQIAEVVLLHENITKTEAKERALSFLKKVGFDAPEDRYRNYPYEMSGGQCQRVMIAMAMIEEPRLLIADEPTTSLDATNEKQILALIKTLCREYGTGVILISHNPELLRAHCDGVYTMQKGRITDFFDSARETVPPACPAGAAPKETNRPSAEPIIRCKGLSKDYRLHSGKVIHALANVSFDIFRGECLGLVGDSGSGKTTLARAIAGLQPVDTGEIIHYVKKPQMIFQDPYSALDPRLKIKDIIAEPMKAALRKGNADKAQKSVKELLATVHLPESYLDCYPYQLSGGQRQKVSIARAISTAPEFVICDEAVSALDAGVQYQILDLLLELKEKYGMTYLFISHDRKVIEYICDRVLQISNGSIIG